MKEKIVLFVVFIIMIVFSMNLYAKDKSTDYKLNKIARVILCENYYDFEDQLYILSVIHNRAKKKYKTASIDTYYKVISEKHQFVCYNKESDRNYSDIKLIMITNAIRDMINGYLYPLTLATHYYNYNLVNPKWRKKFLVVHINKYHVYLV